MTEGRERAREAAQLPRRAVWLTYFVGMMICGAFAWTWAQDGYPVVRDAGRLSYATLLRWGGAEVIAVRADGQWWRLFSANLLHGAWWHLGLNLWAWLSLGAWVEGRLGRPALVACSLAGGLACTAAALGFSAAPMVVGISGVIFALGGLLWGARRAPELADFPSGRLAFWLGVTLALGLVLEGISQAGHLGGLAAGWLLGVGWTKRGPRTSQVIVMIGLLMFLGSTAQVGVSRARRQKAEVWAQLGREARSEAVDLLLRMRRNGEDIDALAANAVAYELAVEGSDLETALELADAALLARPGDPNVLDTRGWVACRAGRPAEGLEFVRLAIEAGGASSDEILEHLEACEEARVDAPEGPKAFE